MTASFSACEQAARGSGALLRNHGALSIAVTAMCLVGIGVRLRKPKPKRQCLCMQVRVFAAGPEGQPPVVKNQQPHGQEGRVGVMEFLPRSTRVRWIADLRTQGGECDLQTRRWRMAVEFQPRYPRAQRASTELEIGIADRRSAYDALYPLDPRACGSPR